MRFDLVTIFPEFFAGPLDHGILRRAREAGLELRPTEVIIFGNARGGTPLMQLDQTAGIDLPLKALVWQDAKGKTWISYNEPSWIARRHGLTNVDALVSKLAALLRAVTTKAATDQ